LLGLFLQLRGPVVTKDSTPQSLLQAMDCLLLAPQLQSDLVLAAAAPSTPAAAEKAPADAGEEQAGSAGAATEETEAAAAASGEASTSPSESGTAAAANKGKAAAVYDLSCVSMLIDFHDFLELFSRVVASSAWIYSPPLPPAALALAPAEGVEGEGEGEREGTMGDAVSEKVVTGDAGVDRSKEQEQEENDNQSTYSLSLSELMADRIGAFKRYFDVASLN
jgi:hypothetical protein